MPLGACWCIQMRDSPQFRLSNQSLRYYIIADSVGAHAARTKRKKKKIKKTERKKANNELMAVIAR